MTGLFMVSIAIKATVIFTLGLGALRVLRRSRAAVRHLLLLAVCAAVLALPVAALVLPPFALPLPYQLSANIESIVPETQVDMAVMPVAGNRVIQSAPGPSESMSVTALALIVEGVGAALALLPVIAGLWQTSRLRATARKWSRGQRRIERLVKDAQIRRQVDVLVHDGLPGPVTCGVWRPVLVFPADAEDWGDEDFEAAAIHELEHVRRHDWATDCFARVVCALYWFHPLAWMTWRQLRLESERAADDAVVRAQGETAYAELLVTVAERLVAGQRHYAIAMASRRDLSLRIRALLDASLPRERAGRRCFVTTVLLAATIVLGVAPLGALVDVTTAPVEQAPPAARFDVTSVKPNNSGSGAVRMDTPANGGFYGENATVGMLIRVAYRIQDQQIVGGPKWLFEDRYDIAGTGTKGGEGTALEKLKTLLADRFNLVTHAEQREQPVLALVLARADGRLGPKMTPSKSACTSTGADGRAASPTPGDPRCGFNFGPGRMLITGQTPAAFAVALGLFAGDIVVDRTGLTGYYDFELSFAPNAQVNSDPPSIFTAVQEQLGLRLEKTKGQVEVLVIDSVEKPTPN